MHQRIDEKFLLVVLQRPDCVFVDGPLCRVLQGADNEVGHSAALDGRGALDHCFLIGRDPRFQALISLARGRR